MALKPFPLTTDPENDASPEGAFPVTIFGVDGGEAPDPELPELPPEDSELYVLTVEDGVLAWEKFSDL